MKILSIIEEYLSSITLIYTLFMPILLLVIVLFNMPITIFYIACVILWLLLFITSLAYMFYNTLSNS